MLNRARFADVSIVENHRARDSKPHDKCPERSDDGIHLTSPHEDVAPAGEQCMRARSEFAIEVWIQLLARVALVELEHGFTRSPGLAVLPERVFGAVAIGDLIVVDVV